MQKIKVVIEGMLVALPIMAARFRHKRRGTHYFTLFTAKAQSDIKEGDPVVVYCDARTGQVQARKFAEFHDGRFENVDPE